MQEFNKKLTDIILKHVAKEWSTTPELLLSRESTEGTNRKLAIQVAIYLTCTYTTYSLQKIGEIFGERDHSTIIHNRDKIVDEMKIYGNTRNLIKILKEAIIKEAFLDEIKRYQDDIRSIHENFVYAIQNTPAVEGLDPVRKSVILHCFDSAKERIEFFFPEIFTNDSEKK